MMLKRLRRRLAVLFTVFTGAVLATALGISLFMAVSQIQNDNQQWFLNSVESVMNQLQYITEMGEDEEVAIIDQAPMVVSIRLNGDPLMVSSEWEPTTSRDTLFDEVKSEAQALGLAEGWVIESYEADADVYIASGVTEGDTASSSVMSMSGVLADDESLFTKNIGGTNYRATYFEWPYVRENGTAGLLEVAVLEDLANQRQNITTTVLGYVLIFLLGLVVLFVANWLLAKLVLRPTAEGIRRQNDFVAAASHELRSPLAVIRSSLSAADASPEAGQAQRFRTAAADETERMGRLIDDLLLLAGGDARSWNLQNRAYDLDTLLIETGETYTALAKEQGCQLSLCLPDATLPAMYGDPDRLRQVLAVLLDNALQYAGQDGSIRLGAEAHKNRVTLTVADDGPGIPDGEKEKVFERFYRADGSRNDKRNFGLGLSIARELAGLMGGSLTIKDSPQGGAAFVLALPTNPSQTHRWTKPD